MSFLIEDTIVTVTEIITLIVGVVLLNMLVLYCCRRKVRREMATEMNL